MSSIKKINREFFLNIFVITLFLLGVSSIYTASAQEKSENRFSSYQPNYAITQWTDDDESSIEVQYSFKYSLYKSKKKGWEIFPSYTGEFDFYMGSRDSGPVVNRVSNPALHFKKDFLNSFETGAGKGI